MSFKMAALATMAITLLVGWCLVVGFLFERNEPPIVDYGKF